MKSVLTDNFDLKKMCPGITHKNNGHLKAMTFEATALKAENKAWTPEDKAWTLNKVI